MADKINRERRSWNMSRIRSKDTKPEILLRKALHEMGFRYRLHDRKLPGSPDLVFPKYRAVIFVHGCFWHRHGCKATATPSTNQEFWLKKFADTITRDKRNIQDLLDCGW
ncbi:MAG: DNA mismatch endonuclease Vsr, partial [Chlorobiaceae bacterium]|nr:DNA mismatch endonuclease Vsr [Chlorobiaceae bacterium]